MSASGQNRKYSLRADDVRFSNRPFGVKRFQTIHRCSVDVARGLVLLFGIGTKALPSWDSRTRRNDLRVGLAVRRTAGPSGHTVSPHPWRTLQPEDIPAVWAVPPSGAGSRPLMSANRDMPKQTA